MLTSSTVCSGCKYGRCRVQARASLHAPELKAAPVLAQKRGAVIGAKLQAAADRLKTLSAAAVMLTPKLFAAAANTAVAEVQARASLHAPELKAAPALAQKRGAVIGAKPQLSAQGLLAAAELAKEREAARVKQVS